MWKHRGAREDSDDDVNKCSDDAVNVAKYKENKNDTRIILTSKVKLVCTVITIIVSVATLFVILIGNPIAMNTNCSSCEGFKAVHLCNEVEEQNRQLKIQLQKAKAEKDTFTCDEKEYNGNEPPGFVCLSASSANNLYECVFGNRSMSSELTDTINVIIRFKLLYPEIADDGKILLEFGLTTLIPGRFNIIVRGKRCKEEPGLCLYVQDDVWIKLEQIAYAQMSEYVQGEITLELHQSNFVLISDHTNIFISRTLTSLSMDTLYPMFGFYNTHLINISQTIFSRKYISYDGTTVDPHLFISKDNTTLSTCQLLDKSKDPTFWESVPLFILIASFSVCIFIVKGIMK